MWLIKIFLSEPIISTFKVFEKIINSNMPNFWLFMLDITPLQLSVSIKNLPKKSLSINDALKNTTHKKNNYFMGPKVI